MTNQAATPRQPGQDSRDYAVWLTTGRDLKASVRAVTPHAARATYAREVPVLGLVRFEVDGPTLHAVATNRFTVGVVRQEQVETAPDDAKFTVAVRAKRLAAILGTLEAREQVTVTFRPDRVEIAASTVLYRLEADPEGERFPRWRELLGDYLRRPHQDDLVGVDSRLLSLFDTARCGTSTPLIVQPRESAPDRPGPITVICGDWFMGAVMPARFAAADAAATAWLADCPPPSAEAQPAKAA